MLQATSTAVGARPRPGSLASDRQCRKRYQTGQNRSPHEGIGVSATDVFLEEPDERWPDAQCQARPYEGRARNKRRPHSLRRDELHADNDGAVDAEQQNRAHEIPRQQDPSGGLKRRSNENRGADDYSSSENKQDRKSTSLNSSH